MKMSIKTKTLQMNISYAMKIHFECMEIISFITDLYNIKFQVSFTIRERERKRKRRKSIVINK